MNRSANDRSNLFHLMILCFFLFACVRCNDVDTNKYGVQWSSHGKNFENNRFTPLAKGYKGRIDLTQPSWTMEVNSSVYCTPALSRGKIYISDRAGYIRAIRADDRTVLWKKHVGRDYYGGATPVPGLAFIRFYTIRTSAAFYFDGSKEYLLVGVAGPADILMIDAENGNVHRRVRLDDHPGAIITQSGQVYGDSYYVGTSSNEETMAASEFYTNTSTHVCCSFRGAFFKIHIPTFTIDRVFHAIPTEIWGVGNFSGNAVWGSSPAIDTKTAIIYIATGNNYEAPLAYEQCVASTASEEVEAKCNNVTLWRENYFNSVIALRLSDFKLVFAKRKSDYDAWSLACGKPPVFLRNSNCPTVPGDDFDFGMAPTLGWLPTYDDAGFQTGRRRVLFIAQKSGFVSCMDATTGDDIWVTPVSPGGNLGGINWGLVADGDSVYVSIYNNKNLPWTLKNGTVVTCGGWASLRQKDGEIRWTTVNPACFDPSGPTFASYSNGRSTTAQGAGAPAVLGDVVLVTSTDTYRHPQLGGGVPTSGMGGYVYALHTATGEILSSYETKASVYGSFSTDGRCAYVGHGYDSGFGFSSGKDFFAWCLPSSSARSDL